MSKKAGCVFAAAWITVAVLISILVIFWLLSTLFNLQVWDEFWIWVTSWTGMAAAPIFSFTHLLERTRV
ncbi:MAG: hypothetical protein QNK37_26545 [Acidobacteriota bacterium]|nr:hypothetical protein [Acidobacteriota bacterium]